jgi:hypothetical protein
MEDNTTRAAHAVRRWPLVLIAAPAAVAVWSGWVGLGTLCGFGLVTPLPGIVAWHLNTAITLPVGVEAYGAYALGAWLAPAGVPATARKFARRSAVGALLLGMTGQVIYHLLAAARAHRAPWPVVVLVACLPVVTLGFGAALTHLLRGPVQADAPEPSADRPDDISGTGTRTEPQTGTGAVARTGTQPGERTGTGSAAGPVREPEPDRSRQRPPDRNANRSGRKPAYRSASPVSGEAAEREFAAEIASGQVPTLYQIRTRLHVGNERAKALRQHIARQALTT